MTTTLFLFVHVANSALLIASGGGHFLLSCNIRRHSWLERFAVSARCSGRDICPSSIVTLTPAASLLVRVASSALRFGSWGHTLLTGNIGSRTWLGRFSALVFWFGSGVRHSSARTLTTVAPLLIHVARRVPLLANFAWSAKLAGNVGSDCGFGYFAVLAPRFRRDICLSSVRALTITSIPLVQVARIFIPPATGRGCTLLAGDIGASG
ncbi:MAG: hypothetical protein WBL39_20090 [Terrimicrobiaceae bacterium]